MIEPGSEAFDPGLMDTPPLTHRTSTRPSVPERNLMVHRGVAAAILASLAPFGLQEARAVDRTAQRGESERPTEQPVGQPRAEPDPRATASLRSTTLRLLLDRSLRATPVRLVGIAHGLVSYVKIDDSLNSTAGLTPSTVSIDDLLGIVAAPNEAGAGARRSPLLVGEPNAPPPVRVVLTDGQRLIGRVVEGKEPAQAEDGDAGSDFAVEVPALGSGPIRIKLDRVVRVEALTDPLAPTSAPGPERSAEASESTDDTVVLVNGDVIHGFVESLGAQVVIQVKPDEPPTIYPLVRVERVRIANPLTPPSGPCVWLSDGSMIALAPGAVSAPDFYAAPGRLGGVLHVKPGEVVGVAFDARTFAPLSGCEMVEYRASPDRAWTRPPRVLASGAPLNAANIEVPGPMTVEWALPAGAARLAGTAKLARSTERWGDCVVVVEDLVPGAAPRRVFSQRLSADAPEAKFDVAIAPGAGPEHRLRLIVESGENGPILDRVVLVRPILLLDASPSPDR